MTEDDLSNDVSPLTLDMHQCTDTVPADGVLDGYKNVLNSTCSFCSGMCKPPSVTGEIGFFNGMNRRLVVIASILGLTLTILWQFFVAFCKPSRKKQEEILRKLI